MNTSSRQPPTGWGNDPLTQYLDDCRNNQWATFANKRSEVIDLITIDGMFRKLFDGAINPRPFLPTGFILRAHSAYLSACGAVMAGQVHDAQALLRVCLEQGGYALYIGDDQARWGRWISRHDSPAALAGVRKEFTHGKVVRHITDTDADLGHVYKTLYDRTIDYGGHPNERGASLNMTIEETEDGGRRFNTAYLNADELMLGLALKTTAQVGICVLRISKVIYPYRMTATGVEFQLDTISRRF